MEHFVRHTVVDGAPDEARGGAPAVRDAAEILARAEADLAEADRARKRYVNEGMPALEPDARIGPLLAPGEYVVAVRRCAVLDRRQSVPRPAGAAAPADPVGLGGDFYVTSRRLVLVGRLTLSFDLGDIEDAVLSGERLLLVARGGTGFSLNVDGPRLLRVEMAAARALASN